ncbi:hypothetical protein HY995_01265 [Candidatus Micrarchaeota archaeon]|nr:hypothetical protein [Candidatus Micrarchaeota archaeon]MBI5176697.1 hypothetical protein [Candidatus Micrarchaeota archaeon]
MALPPLSLPVIMLVVFLANIIPVMPPTWAFLSYVFVTQGGDPLALAVLGAVFSTFGRLVLARISKYLPRFLGRRETGNLHYLHGELRKFPGAEFAFTFFYALGPFPSNAVFIVAGSADLNIAPIAAGFFAGRVISYYALISAAKVAVDAVRPYFSLDNPLVWAADLIGIALTLGVFLIDWKSVVKKYGRGRN